MKTLVKVTPFSPRMKNRVREHGELMWLMGDDPVEGKFLLRSVGGTWRGEEWLGWASFGEVTLVEDLDKENKNTRI